MVSATQRGSALDIAFAPSVPMLLYPSRRVIEPDSTKIEGSERTILQQRIGERHGPFVAGRVPSYPPIS